MQNKELKEVRCGQCNKLLGKGTVEHFEIKCVRCGAINILRAQSPSSEPQEDLPEPINGKLKRKT